MHPKLQSIFVFLIVSLLASVLSFGQAETGQVHGTVTDPSGAVVPNATVTLTNNGTGQARTTQTASNGSYTFTNLQPGSYTVTAEGPGFTPFKAQVDVTVGGRHTMDAQLAVGGGATTTVEVRAEGGAQVNTTDQQLSQVVNQAQITQLPTLDRDPYSLVQIAGNVQTDPTQLNASGTMRGVGVSINGQRSASTSILLDGGENVDTFTANVGQSVPLDSVQEFRVITSNYTAEYGRASGGVVNVATRSGTNAFHGSVYEFNRNSAFASNTYQESAQNKAALAAGQPRNPHDRFNRNQFGYAVGGPILRDRLFFFSSTEWTRVRSTGQQFAYVISPTFLAQPFVAAGTKQFFQTFGANLLPSARVTGTLTPSQIRERQSNGTIVSWTPTGAAAGYTGPVFNLVNYSLPANAGAGDPQNAYSTVNRFDINLTDKTTIFGRYSLQNQDAFPGTNAQSPYLGYNTGFSNFNQNVMGNVTHIFSPAVVNQFKAVYSRLNNDQPLSTAPVGPTLYLARNTTSTTLFGTGINVAMPGYLPFTPGNAIPFGGPQNLYQFYNDLSWTKGSHQLRFGGNYIHIRDNRLFGAYETAVEQLGNNTVLGGLDNLVLGRLFAFQGAVDPKGAFPCPVNLTTGSQTVSPSCQLTLPATSPSFKRNNRFNDAGIYAQDSWKATPRLTLDLGLRWEYYGPQHNANPNLESNFYFGTGNTLFDRIRTGQVLTTPNSPDGSLWKAQYKNFAPRVGFAYDVLGNGRVAVRGGYGISYERNFGNVTYNVIQNPPNYAVASLQAGRDVPILPVTPSNSGPLSGTGVVPLPVTSLRAVDPKIKTSYAHQYSFAIEDELVPNTLVAVEYSGSRGIHQYGISNINGAFFGQVYLGDIRGCTGTGAAAACTASNRLNPQYSNINFRSSNGDSYYNAVNVRLQSSNFRNVGLQLTANYTYAHAIDDLSSTFSESANNLNLGFLDPFNPGLDRGNADFDVRHRFVFSGLWEPTFLAFKNSPSWVNNIFGGWQFAPIFSVHTGYPFTVFDCTSVAVGCPRIVDVGLPRSGMSNVPVGTNVYDYLPLPANAANPYLNPAIGFSDLPICNTPGIANGQCNLTPAQAGISRNAFYGPNNWSLDFGLYKTFRFTERVNMQLRAETFNILNHHNFYVNGSNADISSASAVQTVKGAQGGAGVAVGTSGPNDERRNLQLGIKLNF
jgi:outer membrane receptor protein involved in Fe transport